MEGQPLLQLFGGESARPRLEASQTRLQQLAEAEGLEMSAREMTYNSRLAQELGVWADEEGHGDAFHDLAYRAYFVDGKNIADVEVLVDLAEAAGLDPDRAREVIETRSHQAKVDADWERSRQDRVTGVPTFVAGGERVVGAQPYEVLEDLVLKAGAVRRADEP
jgi:predicted DsbA family dithiol-disulfide isomerase